MISLRKYKFLTNLEFESREASEKGKVKETIVVKGIPNTGLNESAVEALRKTRFRPAKQRERPVGVWITIPINFRLQN